MKITNFSNLPEPLVRAVSYSDRRTGDSDYTVTELIKPPRILALQRQYENDISEDAADRIWALIGSAAHEVLRRSAASDSMHKLVEERVYRDVAGKRISGQVDYSIGPLGQLTVLDYKITSVWSCKEGLKPEWEQQLNCYFYLITSGRDDWPESLQIIALLRDWSKHEAANDPDYPQQQVKVFDVPIWTHEQTEAWLTERIALHEAAKTELPECTPEETWERPETYAVKKKGNKRALKLYDNLHEAELAQASLGRDYAIEIRPAKRPRCEMYCSAAPFCDQWLAWRTMNTPQPVEAY